jgi:hypothetical protein
VSAGLIYGLLLIAKPALADTHAEADIDVPPCPSVHHGGQPELCGVISLQGGGKVHYYFELGTDGAEYDTQIPTAPGTELDITADEPSVMVQESLNLGHLAPDTIYYYRLAVVDSEGTRYSPTGVFSTPRTSVEEAPEIPITEGCSGPISGSGVRLCGTLNPGSSAKVGYYFEVSQGSSCVGGTHFGGPSEIEGQGVAVSTEVKNLAPDTEYTFCLVATNTVGETRGQGLTFMTPTLVADGDPTPNPDQTLSTPRPVAPCPATGCAGNPPTRGAEPKPSVCRKGKIKRHGRCVVKVRHERNKKHRSKT